MRIKLKFDLFRDDGVNAVFDQRAESVCGMYLGVDVVDFLVKADVVFGLEAFFCFFHKFVMLAVDENLYGFVACVVFAEAFKCAYV